MSTARRRTPAQWLEADGVDPKTISRMVDHRRRMSDRATVKKAIAQELAPPSS
jgi:glutathione S-transferase